MVTLRLDTWFWVAKRSFPDSRLAVPAVLAAVVERRVCEGCHGGGQGRDVAGELDKDQCMFHDGFLSFESDRVGRHR